MRPLLALNPYFRRYRGRLLLGFLFIVLSNLFAVYSPQVVREAVDLIAAGITQADRFRPIATPGRARHPAAVGGLDRPRPARPAGRPGRPEAIAGHGHLVRRSCWPRSTWCSPCSRASSCS
jgi:ABC-type multidrug transport system fused ATPase/permease subunit